MLVLTSVVAEAGSEVAVRENEEEAFRLADEVMELIARISPPH